MPPDQARSTTSPVRTRLVTAWRRAWPMLRTAFWSSIWLLYLIDPAQQLLDSPRPVPVVVAGTMALVAISGIYLRLVWFGLRTAADHSPHRPWTVTAFSVGVLAVALVFGGSWIELLVYGTGVAALTLRSDRAPTAILTITAVSVLASVGLGRPLARAGLVGVQVAVVGLALLMVRRLLALIAALRAAQERIVELAVGEERQRFARNLHDLLGRSLSVIVVKSQLAGRLLDEDRAGARDEVGDIESAARRSLREVRNAVTGYRARSLADELDQASETLGGAGIDVTVRALPDEDELPPTVESLLAWSVREGATNVLRHSRASHCEILLWRRPGDQIVLTVRDDGGGTGAPPDGTGLRGLRERAEALDGAVHAGDRPDGGFALQVRLPTAPPEPMTDTLMARCPQVTDAPMISPMTTR